SGPPLSPLQVVLLLPATSPAQNSASVIGRSVPGPLGNLPLRRRSSQDSLSAMGKKPLSRTEGGSSGGRSPGPQDFVRPQPTMVAFVPGVRNIGSPVRAASFCRGAFV